MYQQNDLQKKRSHLGKLGEQKAKEHLESLGYEILETNWHTRYAELDIVATHKNVLIIVEVKTRGSDEYGTPEEAMTPYKIAHVVRSAQYYQKLKPHLPEQMRIDFIGIDIRNDEVLRLNHIENCTG